MGIEGNESADQLAKRGSLYPFTGPESVCGISERVAKRAIRDWVCREHQKHSESTPEQKRAKSFTPKLSAKRSEELLKLNRYQARCNRSPYWTLSS
jgi:hypothetical protein